MAEQNGFIAVASLEELERRGVMVVRGVQCPIAVFAHEGTVAAVDNRCPHLGFPLHKGTVRDGILTCHWHHARFDLCSGCTFDMFADDVPAFATEVRDGQVYVSATPLRTPSRERYLRRLRRGMEQSIGLIQAKSLLGLINGQRDYTAIIREIALYGARFRDDWSAGMTALATVANIIDTLEPETAYLMLYQACRQVAADCAGRPPRRELQPLDSSEHSLETLTRWFRYWVETRHAEGAERTLVTAIQAGYTPQEVAGIVFTGATDRMYSQGGHVLDFCNKAFELLDRIGWEHAAQVLPTLVAPLTGSRGGEELNTWRHPIDLVPLVREAEAKLPQLLEQGAGKSWNGVAELSRSLLVDDPAQPLNAICEAAAAGATPGQLGQAVAYAAALRVARFGTANEVGDWLTSLHSFTYCNAAHQAAVRCPTPLVARGLLHGAMSIYLDRFLNVPPAPLPGEREPLPPVENEAKLLSTFLDDLDQRHEVNAAAQAVSAYLRDGKDLRPLVNTLAQATAREDLDFHWNQMLEGSLRQYTSWQGGTEGEHILVAEARVLAAHCPTQRARLQTAQIALRLHRGENLYEDEPMVEPA